MTWREEWEEAKKLTGAEFFLKYGRYKWSDGYYEGLDAAEKMLKTLALPTERTDMKDLHRNSFEKAEMGYGVNKVVDVSFDEKTGNIVMKGKNTKYKIVLPRFDRWSDVFELITEDWEVPTDTEEALDKFADIIEAKYPHGIRIGDKYIQK